MTYILKGFFIFQMARGLLEIEMGIYLLNVYNYLVITASKSNHGC